MKEEMREISSKLQDVFGNRRIVIGMADGCTYVDIPDDPEIFADLMARLLLTLGKNGCDKHMEAHLRKLDELENILNNNIN